MKIDGKKHVTETTVRYKPLRDYGIIGDCHTSALISHDGSIDWYCPSRFDAPAVFCRLLDDKTGGYFKIAPAGKFDVERHYIDGTNILRTVFTREATKLSITDFMPIHERTADRRGYDVGTSRRILRMVDALDGNTRIEVYFRPTLDYARGATTASLQKGVGVIARKDGNYLSLGCPDIEPGFQENGRGEYYAAFDVQKGDHVWFVLTDADDPDRITELPTAGQCEQQFIRTKNYWEKWVSKCTYQGPFRQQVVRSALTLKLLTYEPTGAIIAAPSTSLPEEIGGERNWDYRYAWVRDSSLILYALLNIGYQEEAADFFEWLQETHQNDPSPELQVLYGIDGRRDIPELTLDHLEGYMCSRPVRIGNAAVDQLQLDIYGEVLTAAYLYFTSKIGIREASPDGLSTKERILKKDWPLLKGLVNRAASQWRKNDDGIWEVRGGPRPFLYSRLMCWAAMDRGIRLAKEYRLTAPLVRWEKECESIRQALLTEGFNKDVGAFTQAFDNSTLDASTLLIPRTGFLPATDAMMQSTIEAIRSRLTHNGLVYRYRSQDGLSGNEGTFTACTFWLVDALALGGRTEEAHDLFDRVINCANDLGLFSEEIEPGTDRLLGNFPQGFTHMALINAAINLAKATKHSAEKPVENETDRGRKAGFAAAEGYFRSS